MEELEEAVRTLEALVGRGARPSRHDARRILLALGEILLEGDEPAASGPIGRLRAVVERVREAWEKACGEELALAASEHVQGVDPRWLSHPRFDLAYVVEARRRLEMRLRAMERLGQEPDEVWLDRIAQADQLLQPHLEDRP